MHKGIYLLIYTTLVLITVTVSLIVVFTVTAEDTYEQKSVSCPDDYNVNPVVIISMDGFRAEYIHRGLTPMLKYLYDNGVRTAYMKPSHPSLTFPNHYSIATGLYPESHGIIANSFYDPEFDEFFSLSSAGPSEGKWWDGEPIWVTLNKSGKISATYFWPGSEADIQGLRPTYWYPYDNDVPFEDRVDQVLNWLTLPESERPVWISMYIDEPDHTGHDFGPDSDEVNAMLIYVDSVMERLMQGISAQNISQCVNLIFVSDHGMATAGENKTILLDNYVPDITNATVSFSGAFSRLWVKERTEDEKVRIMSGLSCQRPQMRVYDKVSIPKRYHFSNNRRIEDIILDLDNGYSGHTNYTYTLGGHHGYDNYISDMNTVFIAYGPDFRKNYVAEPFQNIELYNLLCHLTMVTPAPNNGTQGALYDILALNTEPPVFSPEDPPSSSKFPPDEIELQNRLNISKCPGDLDSVENWIYALNTSLPEDIALQGIYLPWGIPTSGSLPADLILLHHDDHVTGFSQHLKMPLWASASFQSASVGASNASWSSDVRLNSTTTPTCVSYTSLPSDINMEPLFPPQYSIDSRIAFIVSNAVPMSSFLKQHWDVFWSDLFPTWLASGPLNIMVGPVFDHDLNSRVDDFTNITYKMNFNVIAENESLSNEATAAFLTDFVNKYEKCLSIPDLKKADVNNLWFLIFKKLENSAALSVHLLCLSSLRILSRLKENLGDVIDQSRIKRLVSLSGFLMNEDDLNSSYENDFKVMVEAEKCLCNLIYNNTLTQQCCSELCLLGLVHKLKTFRTSNIPFEIKSFDMKILFLLSALSLEARSILYKEHQCHNYILNILDHFLKSLSCEEIHEFKKEECDYLCTLLKSLYNLLLNINKTSTNSNDMEYCFHLVDYLWLLLHCSGPDEHHRDELISNTVSIFLLVPISTFSVLNLCDVNQQSFCSNKCKSGIKVLLEFLSKRLNSPGKVNSEFLTPILMLLVMLVQFYRSVRKYVRQIILPPLRDTSKLPEEGTSLRNRLCYLMTSHLDGLNYLSANLLFVLCKESVGRMVKYTGYGNAAGLLASRGLLLGGQRKVNYYSSDSDSDTEEYKKTKDKVNPITGRFEEMHLSPLQNMTEEQKEYEAMKLVNALDTMTRNDFIKPCVVGEDGKPHPVESVLQLQGNLPQDSVKTCATSEDESN